MSGSPQRRIEVLERRLGDAMPAATDAFLLTLNHGDRAFLLDIAERGLLESLRGLSKADKQRAKDLRAQHLAFVLKEVRRTK